MNRLDVSWLLNHENLEAYPVDKSSIQQQQKDNL